MQRTSVRVPASLRAAARELIQEWKEYSEKEQQKKAPSNPEREALRQRILEHKNEPVTRYNKKSNTSGILTIVDCDEEVVILSSNGNIFTYPLVDVDTTKQFLNGRMQFVLVFKDR
jgi:hypothetical protein